MVILQNMEPKYKHTAFCWEDHEPKLRIQKFPPTYKLFGKKRSKKLN